MSVNRKQAEHRARNLDAGVLQAEIDSHQLELGRLGRSDRTRTIYREAAQWLAGEWLVPAGVTDWSEVTRDHLREWCAQLREMGYSDSYINNQWRALKAFFKWYSAEEDIPNITAGMEAPQVAEKPVPVFDDDEMRRLLATVSGKDFTSRRDYAIMCLLRDTGIRLDELVKQTREDFRILEREVTVTGKGGKTRTVKYSYDTARALDRYTRQRAKQAQAHLSAMWIGPKGTLTRSGVQQMLERRGQQAGVDDVYPHRFRHHFSHTWLDKGGAEGDLMELNGWESPQMLRRYGRSAAAARARRSYDKVMGE